MFMKIVVSLLNKVNMTDFMQANVYDQIDNQGVSTFKLFV